MGKQDGGLRPKVMTQMRKILGNAHLVNRVRAIETGSVTVGVADIIWDYRDIYGLLHSGWTECKQWKLISTPTAESIFTKCLSPAQKAEMLTSEMLGATHHILAEWKKPLSEPEYFVVYYEFKVLKMMRFSYLYNASRFCLGITDAET